jgi:hypothetical protein
MVEVDIRSTDAGQRQAGHYCPWFGLGHRHGFNTDGGIEFIQYSCGNVRPGWHHQIPFAHAFAGCESDGVR